MTLDMTRFVARYLVEARGHLTTITRGLPALQHGCCDRETIHALFVSAHTIKGGAGMLKLKPIAELADHLEEALSALLEGRVPLEGSVWRQPCLLGPMLRRILFCNLYFLPPSF